MIAHIAAALIAPFARIAVRAVLWRARRRSKADCTYTLEEIQAFHHQLKSTRIKP